MAAIVETLVLQDKASTTWCSYIQAAQKAASSTNTAKTAAQNYQSVLNSVSRQLIGANSRFEVLVEQQEAMAASGQQDTAAFKRLDAETEKLGASIRTLEAQQRSLSAAQQMAAAAAEAAADAKEDATAATKSLSDAQTAAQNVTTSLTGAVVRLAASYLSIQGLKKAVDLSDTLVSSRARLDRMNDGLQTTKELEDMAYAASMRSRGDFMDTMGLVSQLGTMAGDAFNSSREIVQFAEQLNKQLALSGASGASAQAAVLQLEQGLASGVLRGDELNSVMEQAPALAKSIAEYLGVGVGQLREMGSQGQITADIVKNALFSAAEETNAEFAKTPMTWAQVWTAASNMAIRAMDPLLAAINWVANNIQTIGPIVVSLGTAFSVMLIAANWANILTFATEKAAAAQAFLNAVMSANPAALAAVGVLVLVAAFYAGIAAVNHFAGTSISATGIITGVFATMGAFVFNSVLVPWQNGFAAFVNFLANVFTNPLAAVKIAFYDMAITVMQYLQNIAQGLEGLLNKIPGVTFDLTSGVNATVTKLQRGRKYEKWASGYTEVVKPWENIDLGKAYTKGYNWGANFNLSAMLGGGSGSPEVPQAADIKDLLTNIDKNTGKISKTVDLSDEQIKMMVDIAERKYVNNINLTSQTPVITVNGQNTGNTLQDAEDVANVLRDLLLERMSAGSTVPVG